MDNQLDKTLDIITIFNPDQDPIEVRYNNTPYGVIQPGKSMNLPRFLAEHATKHLIDQMLNRANVPTNNESKRKEAEAKIWLHEQSAIGETPKSQEELLAEKVAQLNAQPAPVPAPEPTPAPPPAPTPAVPQPEPQPEPEPVVEVTPEPTPAPVVEEAPAPTVAEIVEQPQSTEPTREQLYNYARGTLGMDLTDKNTQEALDKQDIPQLINTLGWTPPTA